MSSVGMIGQVLLVVGGILTLVSTVFFLGILFRLIPGWVHDLPGEEFSHDTSYFVLPLWHFLLPLLGSVIILFSGYLFKSSAKFLAEGGAAQIAAELEEKL